MRQQAARFFLFGPNIYRRGYSWPLLKCISHDQADYVMREIHEGVCGTHSGERTIVARILKASYNRLTVQSDCTKFVRKCLKCQEYDTLSHQKLENQHYTLSPWPFAKWGMDIIGPFNSGKGQCKFMLIWIDYFTKWIEVEPLTLITTRNIQNFVWKNIIFHFDIPHVIIIDNVQ